MGLLDRFKKEKDLTTSFEMITEGEWGNFQFGNNIYKSDIVRSAIRPKARALGKAVPKHVRDSDGEFETLDNLYIKKLLKEPNPFMSWQQLIEKLITHLELNNNAFALVVRNDEGLPIAEYPISASSVRMVSDAKDQMYYKFLINGSFTYFKFEDVIHLRKDFNAQDHFGDSPKHALLPLMDVVATTDKGIVEAVKTSSVIRWLLKFTSATRPEQIKEKTKDFIDSFLRTDGKSAGAAGIDTSVDAVQVEPKSFIPDDKQIDKTIERILSFFNTNKNIIQSSYTENQWISYYESICEPDLKQLSDMHTKILLTLKQRIEEDNIIYFDGSDLSFASMETKLKLVQLVDREIMSVEEHRSILKLGPKKSGHTFIRRLDTERTEKNVDSGNEKGGD